MSFTDGYSVELRRVKDALSAADAVIIGAGAGLSASAGYVYSGKRFHENFHDFEVKYNFHDMYTGGFYPYETPEEKWAYWSRYVYINRYTDALRPVYDDLLRLVADKNYFVITTNVDHCFQKAGFDKTRLFYTQGDYGLFQCAKPCHRKTYDNEETVKKMYALQRDMKVPSELIPRCPVCGGPMSMNLRADDTFVEDDGWIKACDRYNAFVSENRRKRVVFLELGVGGNTPVIIKYPFWRMTAENEKAIYVCVNYGEAVCPDRIKDRSVLIDGDVGETLAALLSE